MVAFAYCYCCFAAWRSRIFLGHPGGAVYLHAILKKVVVNKLRIEKIHNIIGERKPPGLIFIIVFLKKYFAAHYHYISFGIHLG